MARILLIRIIWLFKELYIFLSTKDSQILHGLQREKLQGCVVKVYTTNKSLKRTVTGKELVFPLLSACHEGEGRTLVKHPMRVSQCTHPSDTYIYYI